MNLLIWLQTHKNSQNGGIICKNILFFYKFCHEVPLVSCVFINFAVQNNRKMIKYEDDDIEVFLEKQGFEFHACIALNHCPYISWSFGNISYSPTTKALRAKGKYKFAGTVDSLKQFKEVLEILEINISNYYNKARAKENAKFKMERKIIIANKVADKIQERFGFRREKCLNMAMSGSWWQRVNRTSQLRNDLVNAYAEDVISDIENGTMI